MKEAFLEELDLLGLEDACTKKYFDSIPAWYIELLQESLSKSKDHNKLEVHNTAQKHKQKSQRDSKKRGRKYTLQTINRLGPTLVESTQYTQLTKFFSSHLAVIQ